MLCRPIRAHLPRSPEGLVVGHLDLGGDLGGAPAGVLQRGRHDVARLQSLLLSSLASLSMEARQLLYYFIEY